MTKKEIENLSNFSDFALHLDKDKNTFYLICTREDSPGIIEGKIGTCHYHYNVPRGVDADGYFTGDLIITQKIPFHNLIYFNHSEVKMSKTEEATIVKESVETSKDENKKEPIFILKINGGETPFYWYDPSKHGSVKNPKSELSLSRKNARYWTREKELYLQSQTAAAAAPKNDKATKDQRPLDAAATAKLNEKINSKSTPGHTVTDVNLSKDAQNLLANVLNHKMGMNGIAFLTNVQALPEQAHYIGLEDKGDSFIVRVPGVHTKQEPVLMIFPKSGTAEFFLLEMSKLPHYKKQFEPLKSFPTTLISQADANTACLVVLNVKEFISAITKPIKPGV